MLDGLIRVALSIELHDMKAHAQMPTFAGSALESALESANSSPDSTDSTIDFMRVGQLPVIKYLIFIIPRDGTAYTFSIVLPCGEQVNKR